MIEGKAPEASPGRADDFSQPPKASPATAAASDTTTAISP
ncbi:hypothetical protein ACVWWD_000536 [Mesorhizobium sp. URHB0026]